MAGSSRLTGFTCGQNRSVRHVLLQPAASSSSAGGSGSRIAAKINLLSNTKGACRHQATQISTPPGFIFRCGHREILECLPGSLSIILDEFGCLSFPSQNLGKLPGESKIFAMPALSVRPRPGNYNTFCHYFLPFVLLSDRAFHLKLDQPVHFDRIFHR